MNVQNIDPWKHIVKALEPDIDDLTKMLNAEPKICPYLVRRSRKWEIHIQEKWNHDFDYRLFQTDGDRLGQAVDWTIEQLENWNGVKRMAYDIWQFNRKKDAEKFQTLFNLKWAG